MIQLMQSKVLIVDDNFNNVKLLNTIMKHENYTTYLANNGYEALEKCNQYLPDIILLDIMMPGMSGFEVTEKIKSNENFVDIPIILITALNDMQAKVKGLSLGAEDFITKPFNHKEVSLRVRNLLRLKKMNDLLRHNMHLLNYVDELTSLPNLNACINLLSERMTENSEPFILMALQIDELQALKMAFEKEKLNLIIKSVADRLINFAKQYKGLLSHQDSGNFFMILPFMQKSDLTDFSEQLKQRFNNTFFLEDEELTISLSLGCTSYPGKYNKPENLLHICHSLISQNTKPFKINYDDQGLNTRASEFLRIKSNLQQAIEKNEILQYYQPIIDLSSEKIIGVEALMRWKNRNGFIPLAKFIPIIENAIYTQKFHEWTLNAATILANEKKLQIKNFYISVNVSPEVFLTDYFIPSIEHALSQLNGSSVRLAIEITESCILTDPLKAIDRLEILKEKGVNTFIDDFGTGYCSFAYLKDLPVSTLKIDKLFIDDLVKSKSAYAVVECIISLTKNLGLSVISEGIETKAQLEALINLGCHAGQGFLFYQPMNRDDLLKLLTSNQ